MAKYSYPAILTIDKNEDIVYVQFPDIDGCHTHANNITEAMFMAEDVLNLMLIAIEDNGGTLPTASNIIDLSLEKNMFGEYATDEKSVFKNIVACDTTEYRKKYDNKSMKKTLTIPIWLNNKAESAGVNFSGVLQNALISNLGL